MAALISFFVVVVLSLVIVRIATVLLVLSGLSEDSARFQARSAFTGTGFTTRETENVVNHPFRRRVIMILMLVRNFGFVTVLSTLILSFVGTSTNSQLLVRAGILAAGLLLVYLLSRSKLIDRWLRRLVETAMRNSQVVRIADYEHLLNLSGEYEIIESPVRDDSWLAGRTLEDSRPAEEGILILGIRRADGYYVGAPTGSSFLQGGDRVIMYGREAALREMSERSAGAVGEEQHREAVRRQRERGTAHAGPEMAQAPAGARFGRVFRRLFGRGRRR